MVLHALDRIELSLGSDNAKAWYVFCAVMQKLFGSTVSNTSDVTWYQVWLTWLHPELNNGTGVFLYEWGKTKYILWYNEVWSGKPKYVVCWL